MAGSRKKPAEQRRSLLLPNLAQKGLTPSMLQPAPSKRQSRKHPKIRGSEARTVRTRGRRIYTGLHPLDTLDGKMLASEAAIERDFWVVVDFIYPTLTEATAQPFTIPIDVLGLVHDWTPDALLLLADGSKIVVETKPLIFFQPDPPEPAGQEPAAGEDQEVIARSYFEAWTAAVEEYGLKFLGMTEAEVRTEPRFYNAKLMHRAMGSPLPDHARDIALAALMAGPMKMTIKEFSSQLGPYRLSAMLIAARLDREGLVRIDRTNFWSPHSYFENLISCGGEPG